MGSYWLMGAEFKLCKMRVLEWMVVMVVQQYEYLIPLIYTVKMDKMINCMLCVFCHNKNWFMRISRYEIDKWVTSYLRHR